MDLINIILKKIIYWIFKKCRITNDTKHAKQWNSTLSFSPNSGSKIIAYSSIIAQDEISVWVWLKATVSERTFLGNRFKKAFLLSSQGSISNLNCFYETLKSVNNNYLCRRKQISTPHTWCTNSPEYPTINQMLWWHKST